MVIVRFWMIVLYVLILNAMDGGGLVFAANRGPQEIDGSLADTGKGLYGQACLACHGRDGTGSRSSRIGFKTPLPDFTDCSFAFREGDADWIAVTAEGGPARGFSDEMPAFGDALTDAQITEILDYMRGFCRNKDWPRGELNLPRPLFTTKAFPEDELVLTSSIKTAGNDKIANALIYEKRIGARNQVEIVFPFGWGQYPKTDDPDDTQWESSIGDIALSGKRVLYASLDTGAILSLGGELLLPTGDDDKGFGNGTTLFEPYVAYGQILPAEFFLQFQGGGAISFDRDKAENEIFWKLAAGRAFYQGHFGRRWTPMVEVLGATELASNGNTHWDVAPQFQVTLSSRQHIRLNIGARIPLNDRDNRDMEVGVYLLWDWFDGGLFEGW
ncbi:MAG: cytochrome c [Deltaproteobacteria bacterium]|nr:cytochrome c [Deltaproteobacteria bacterium]